MTVEPESQAVGTLCNSEVAAQKRDDTERSDASGWRGSGLKAVAAVGRFDHLDFVSNHENDVNRAVGGDVDLG